MKEDIDHNKLQETLRLLEPEVADAYIPSYDTADAFQTAVQLSIATSLKRLADLLSIAWINDNLPKE